MSAPNECLHRRVYNVTAMSFTPEELVEKLSKYVPELRVTYKPDSRQNIGKCIYFNSSRNILLFWFCYDVFNATLFCIMLFGILIHLCNFNLADSWPQVFDDSDARRDWKWRPKYDLDKLVELMVRDVRVNYLKEDNNGNQMIE